MSLRVEKHRFLHNPLAMFVKGQNINFVVGNLQSKWSGTGKYKGAYKASVLIRFGEIGGQEVGGLAAELTAWGDEVVAQLKGIERVRPFYALIQQYRWENDKLYARLKSVQPITGTQHEEIFSSFEQYLSERER